jgi:putative endonuclease
MPLRDHNYYVYVTTNRSYTVLYTGVTGDLDARIAQHKSRAMDGFTKRYRVVLLVYYEWCLDINAAIAREKQIKNMSHEKKVALIESMNPCWVDLREALFPPAPAGP